MKKNRKLISVIAAKKKMLNSLKNFKNKSELIDFRDKRVGVCLYVCQEKSQEKYFINNLNKIRDVAQRL